MNFKELLLPLSIVLVVSLGMHLFLSRRVEKKSAEQESVSGQMYEIKHDPEVVAPLSWDVNLAETDEQKAQLTHVFTEYGELVFTSAGAALERLIFKHNGKLLTAVETKNPTQKMFLIALADKTPYIYTFAGQQEDEKSVSVRYSYQLPDAVLTKTFVVDKQVPRIDLVIQLDTLSQNAPAQIEAIKKMRIFYPSPLVAAMNVSEIMAFVNDVHNPQTLKIKRKLNEILYKTWSNPTIFGAADKFFVHAMVNDHDNLIYRGAFNAINDDKDLLVQLETNEMMHAGQWKITFYVGPKQLAFMNAVDNRLEQVLDYGFWSPIAKVILWILNFLYKYLKNYGLAILVFTFLFQLLLLPLSISSQKSMEKQAELNKKMQYLKQKYRTDPERLRQEQAELMRTHGVGGFVGGCVLLLVQVPIFFALNRLLSSCFELHNERFLWIPNLASYDPWYILPVLSFLAILFRAHSPGKPFTQQLSMYAFALVFGAVMTKLPAGLVLFILVGAVANVGQMYLLKLKR